MKLKTGVGVEDRLPLRKRTGSEILNSGVGPPRFFSTFVLNDHVTQHQNRMHPGGAPADPRAAPKRRGQNRKQTATRARSPGGTYVCTECNPEWRTPRQKEFLTHLTAVHGRQSHH